MIEALAEQILKILKRMFRRERSFEDERIVFQKERVCVPGARRRFHVSYCSIREDSDGLYRVSASHMVSLLSSTTEIRNKSRHQENSQVSIEVSAQYTYV